MDLIEIGKKIISFGAPILGGAIAGPAGVTVAKMIADSFGLSSSEPQAIVNAINLDPSAQIKLREFELTHKLELQKLIFQAEISKEEINQKDRDSAREMRVKAPLDNTPRNIAYLIIGGFICTIAGLFFDKNITAEIKEPLMLTLGYLSAKASSIVDFYFGSSSIKN